MPFTKQPQAEPIPGYRLLTPLGSGGFGEVWKCQAPGGLFKAIKFVYGNLKSVEGDASQAHEELQAIERIKDLRHPFLLSIDRLEWASGELMIVTELADKNLHELLQQYQQQGQAGVPRAELLHYLGEAAEVLDLMNGKYGLQHLDVKPRNFFLVGNHVKVADFGLVTSMAANKDGVKLGAVTPLYAAPEVFQGKVSATSDQYSLAVCFMELLTGKLPFDGRNSRQLLVQHLQVEPDLSPLDDEDRAMVGRAMSKDPTKRYGSCTEFIRDLEGKQLASTADFTLADSPASAGANSDLVRRRFVPPAAGRSEALMPTKKLTDTERLRFCKAPPSLPAALAGYQFVENQGSSLLADVWKATAPDGRLRQVKLIYGFTGQGSRTVQEAVRRLEALHHPALEWIEVVQTEPGRLVLLSDLARDTLRDRWIKCQSQKLSGIPRGELLGYLRTVAEAIDYLYQQHSVYHLGLNPRTLQFTDGNLLVTEFGLAHLFWLPAGQPVAQRNARYAAPELFEQQVHRSTDQYSLALIYQELLTGVHAFAGQHRSARGKVKPDLSSLPAEDQSAIARALDPDPQQRWPSCGDLIRALEATECNLRPPSLMDSDAFTDIISAPTPAPCLQEAGVDQQALVQILNDLLAQVGGELLSDDAGAPPELSADGSVLTHRFRVGLPVGAARVKVDGFRQQANGVLLRDEEEAYDFHVPTPTNFWQQWIGRQPGLDVCVQLARQHALSATPIDVTVTVKAVRSNKKKAAQLVEDLGTNLLEGLRACLLVNSEKRTQDRLLWPHPVQVCPVEEDGTVGPAIVCRGKDISLGGMGFYLPNELPTSQVVIHMPTTAARPEPVTIPATLVRAQRCADGWYDVGALFRLASLRKTMPEVCLT